jgi:hypothetical protein
MKGSSFDVREFQSISSSVKILYLESSQFRDEFCADRLIAFAHIRLARFIVSFHVFPELHERFKDKSFWGHRISFIIDEIGHLICLRTIRDHEEWKSMDTGEYTSMESHPDDSMEGRVELHSLFDRIGSIISTTIHYTLDEESVILRLISFCRMEEKYRIIPLLDKIVIDLRNFILIISEESSSDRYAYSFLFWHLIDLLRDREKCKVWNMRTWNLESLEKSCTLLISDDDEVSLLKYFTQHHLMFHLLNLERDTEIDYRSTRHTSYLRTEVPLIDEICKTHSFFIIKYEPASSDDHDISTSDTPEITDQIPYIHERITKKSVWKICQPSY